MKDHTFIPRNIQKETENQTLLVTGYLLSSHPHLFLSRSASLIEPSPIFAAVVWVCDLILA